MSATSTPVANLARPRAGGVVWSPWGAFGIVAIYLVGVGLLSAAIFLGLTGYGAPEEAAFVMVDSVAIAAAVYLWVRWRHPGEAGLLWGRRELDARTLRNAMLLGLGLGIAWAVTTDLGMDALITALPSEPPPVQGWITEQLAMPVIGLLLTVDVIVLTPVAEELFFRGFLFQSLVPRIGTWPAAVVSAAIFAAAHFEPTLGGTMIMVAATFPFGVAAAWLLRRTGTLLVPILLHAVTNASASLWEMLEV